MKSILKSEKFRKLFHVNRPLIPLKVIIFLWFLGRGFGSFIGGLLIDAVNIRNTFLIMAISSFSFTIIYLIGYVVILIFFPNKRPFEPSNLSENHSPPDLEKSVSSKDDTKLSIQDNHVKL